MASTGLRERKKLETRREIVAAARELVAARGLHGVTVDEIATAAGVSPRTFFNYFPSKEDAVVGVDPAVIAEKADELRARPAGERPVEALREVLISWVDPQRTLPYRQLRDEMVERHPELTPRYLAVLVDIQAAFAVAMAERMGTDQFADPRPDVIVAATFSASRSAMSWWERSDRSRPLLDVMDEAFDLVARMDDSAQP
jgi:AcrR family transcriptional regulator